MTKVSTLTKRDFVEIVQVWEKSVIATHHFLTPDEISFYKPLILKYYLPELLLYGIKKENKLLGFVGIKDNKIEMLFILPSAAKSGYGRILAEFSVKNHKVTLVDCNEENPKALEFYKHIGFKIISRDELDERGKPHPILHLSL